MKISIIIPVYNVSEYISSCLKSVFSQSFNDYEVILIDDCGSDDSISIAKSVIEDFNKIEYVTIIKHSHNKGLSAARNTGVKQAKGDYIFFLDSDDQLGDDALMAFYNSLNNHGDVDFIVGNMNVVGNLSYNILKPEVLDGTKSIVDHYIAGKCYMMACGKLINRAFFINQSLWFPYGRLHEDELFSFQLVIKANKAVIIKDIVYNYLIRNGSITTRKGVKNYIDILWCFEEMYKSYKGCSELFNSQAIQKYFLKRYLDLVFNVCNSNIDRFNIKFMHSKIKLNIDLLENQYFTIKDWIKYLIIKSPTIVVRIIYKILVIKNTLV